MPTTFEPDNRPPTAQEEKDLREFLRCLRLLRVSGGWGSVTVSLKAGDLDELVTSIRDKPKVRPGE